MSEYKSDKRVVLHDDGTATITEPSCDGCRDWQVERGTAGRFVLRDSEGYLVTDASDRHNQRPRAFDTADEAVAYVIGDPQ